MERQRSLLWRQPIFSHRGAMNLGAVLIHTSGGVSGSISTLKTLFSTTISMEGKTADMTFSLIPDKPVQMYQAIKNGISKPSNFELMYSRSVFYKESQTDQYIRDWAYARAKSEGNDVVIYIDNVANFSVSQLVSDLSNIKGDILVYK